MKKKYEELKRVTLFIEQQSSEIQAEYNEIVTRIESDGKLHMPFGEKVTGAKEKLFAIRVISAGNIRVFYVYGYDDYVWGIHGYVKKTKLIPKKELNTAIKICKEMRQVKMIP